MRILVVDSDEVSRRALSLLFQNDGHEVAAVDSLRDAQSICVDQSFDVLICGNTRFADGNAFDLMRAVAERCGARGILLDGDWTDANRLLAKAAGFGHHFQKPVTYDQLHNALAAVS